MYTDNKIEHGWSQIVRICPREGRQVYTDREDEFIARGKEREEIAHGKNWYFMINTDYKIERGWSRIELIYTD